MVLMLTTVVLTSSYTDNCDEVENDSYGDADADVDGKYDNDNGDEYVDYLHDPDETLSINNTPAK